LGHQTARAGCPQPGQEGTGVTPEIKMGVLLERSPAGRQALATWAFKVIRSGMQLRGPNMLLDMRLLVVSDETPDSDPSESMALEWLRRSDRPGQYNRVRRLSPGWPGLPAADSSLFAHE